MRLTHAARTRLRLLFARRDAESRMNEEFRFHLEMEADRLVRDEGLEPQEARRRARLAFGYMERHKEEMRDGRGLRWLGGLSLDLKLGFRMLVKYPGLTVVGGLAMAFAIWVGAVVFQVVMLFVDPTLPLPGGDRVVYLRNWDVQANEKEPRALHDFVVWRQAMRSVTDFGAWQDVVRNLKGRDGEARPVQVAAITASGFRVAATRPLLGRVLVPADEHIGAPPVVVLGHAVWRARFAADSTIVGQSVQLGDVYATVVGVMPPDFRFPIAHDAWTPFRPAARDDAPRRGPAITIFGRLAPGATLDDAKAELAVLGQRAARDLPATHEHLQPQVMPYAQMIGGAPSAAEEGAVVALTQIFALMLLVLVCGNVALLLFARAATRESEIIVRSALGASRRRIVLQLFAEALVLGGVAAGVGLAAAQITLRQWALPFLKMNYDQLPFWFDPRVTPATVLYAGVLTVLGAAIAGGLPGLKVTRGIGSRLRAGTTGGGGLQFGGVWTAVIVAQVAVTVAFPGLVLVEGREQQRIRSYDAGFAADEYLTVKLDREATPGVDAAGDAAAAAAYRARLGMLVETLRQRVAAEPGVVGVTFVDQLPRTNYDYYRIGLDDSASAPAGAAAARQPRRYTKVAFVDPSYFDVLRAPILAGRGFQAADLAPGARVAIVDQGFVDQALQGRNPIGRRVRVAENGIQPDGPGADSLPWLQIVGVVKNLGMIGAAETTREIGLYRPATPGSGFPPQMMIHTQGEPMALVPRVRAIAGALDPTLRLSQIQRADQVADDLLWMLGMWLRTTLAMTAVALLLSLAGIYAVLSFTVARRTREIGVRVALGAPQRTVLAAIFRRPLTQVGLGIAAGATLVALGALGLARTYQFQDWPKGLSLGQIALLVVYAAFMLGVCLLACVVPTRRALRVEPIVAMRVD
ncbi:MacB-like periplasmic core domain protein [Gemmatirosa kalamazoonensis]|uniref:MacB-like periplasmic core domain protein n=1 Tax=Gemmatirosa kalamazoonensis TaxID=861299 RepID=W0RFF1_9BACT|nr:ABC transporter permease [Gemmatirosa kalamazoonensis]AHG89809.1 MacB-like periplasmic core domain protein [Gemmatirosa kalamazoonensis]